MGGYKNDRVHGYMGIIFLMMTHHNQNNDAMIINKMTVDTGLNSFYFFTIEFW